MQIIIHKHYNGLYLFLHPTDENDIDAGALFEYMRYTQEKKKMRFDRVFLNLCQNHLCLQLRKQYD